MPLAFRYAAASDTGRVRSKNDDSAYTGRYLAVVADGMGGHVGGNVASASTVLDLTPLDRPGYTGQAGTYLADEIQTANIILNKLVEVNPLLAGMGTTCTALLVDGDGLELAHIGDSRAYRLRDGELQQMTTDHTFVQRLVEEGRIRPEEAENHPHKNVVMRVLGDTDASPELQLEHVDARPGDRWLLCSDGLSGVVPEAMIHAALRDTEDLQQICDVLVHETLERGAPDNVTVAVVQVEEEASLSQAVTSRIAAVPQREREALQEPTAEDPEPWKHAPADAEDSGTPAEDPATGGYPSSGAPLAREARAGSDEETDASEGSASSGAGSSAAGTRPEDEPGTDGDAVGLRQVAPWRRRLPRDRGQRVRHILHHGAWRGDSFSDSVLNAMTQRSGMDLEDLEHQEETSASALRHELAERPHMLVGAAESATMTGAIPTVTDSTVKRRATLARTHAAEEAEVDDELPEELLEELESSRARKRRRGASLFVLAFVVVLVAGLAWASWAWVTSQYYVSDKDGYVAVYNGVSQSIGPLSLSSEEETSTVKVSDLPDFSQSRVRDGITASSLDDAHRIVSDLGTEAKDHQAHEKAAASASATPRPQGTVSTADPSASASASASKGGS